MIDWRSSKFRLIGSALTADTGALQKLNTSFQLNENFCFEFKKKIKISENFESVVALKGEEESRESWLPLRRGMSLQ